MWQIKKALERGLGGLDRIQTCNLLIRSQMLYSVELRNHFFRAANIRVFSGFATLHKKILRVEKDFFILIRELISWQWLKLQAMQGFR